MSLNDIQNLILLRSYDLMNLQACVVLFPRNLWIQMVLNLWTLMILEKSFCLHKKACLTSSFLLDGLTDPDRNVAYLTTRVFEFRRLTLEHDRQKILVRGLRGPLLCDEAYELRLSLDLLAPSWSRGLAYVHSSRELLVLPCGVTSLALQTILQSRSLRICAVQL